MKCIKCGLDLKGDALDCYSCGAKQGANIFLLDRNNGINRVIIYLALGLNIVLGLLIGRSAFMALVFAGMLFFIFGFIHFYFVELPRLNIPSQYFILIKARNMLVGLALIELALGFNYPGLVSKIIIVAAVVIIVLPSLLYFDFSFRRKI